MSDKIKLLNVNIDMPPGYKKSFDNRAILIEYENNRVSQVNLNADGSEPTFKLDGGETLSSGYINRITVDKSAKAISTTEKYTNGSSEIKFLVRRYVSPREICRSLKKEVEKYDNVTYNYSFNGYQADLGNGNYILYGVVNKCLVIITTNDLTNATTTIKNKKINNGALTRLVLGIMVILFALIVLAKIGIDGRLAILISVSIVLISTGYKQLYQQDVECPKIKI